MFRMALETEAEADEVEALYDLAFAPGRTALSSYQLRRDVAPLAELALTARDETGALAGAIRYWPVRIGAPGDPALLLGPIAVHPVHQGEGLGALLIGESLARAVELGWSRAILVGDEPYYGRFGFSRNLAHALDYPKPVNMKRLLAKELQPDAMSNVGGMVRRWHED